MIIHEKYTDLGIKNPIVTIGVFDGVHLGHQALLHQLVSTAKEKEGESVVITFNPHPRLVLEKDNQAISILTTVAEKKQLVGEFMVDHLVVIDFTRELGNLDATDFIRKILVKEIGIKHLILGFNNHFGRAGSGDISVVRECGKMFGFSVERAKKFSSPDGIISSTVIREALLAGNLEMANKFLGYNYSITGKVVKGKQLGKSLGFPTANIRPDDSFKLIPADGVYAVGVRVGNNTFGGALSIGFNPTVNPEMKERTVEVHIFDFDNYLYGETITVFFRYRLREERKFANTDFLVRQMKIDTLEARRLLE